jgi:hypothetical protein
LSPPTYIDPLNFGHHAPLAAVPAFLLSIVILLVSHNIASFRELERASSDSDRIYEAVKDYLHVTKLGSPESATKYVIARMPILHDVRNTSLNIRDEIERAEEQLYDTAAYSDFASHIVQWTAHELRWKEIGDHEAIKRMRRTAAQTRRRAPDGRPNYQYKLISHNEPQINFILLSYADGTNEVLFNWDFRNIGQDPVVLLSRDRDIVEMFAVQFEHLWRSASPDHDTSDHDRMAARSTSKK